MIIEKINDFLNCYFEIMGITNEEIRQLITSSIIKRYNMYKDVFPMIPISEDNYQNYAIKSKNGYYKLEDFLLNRLFQGLRDIIIVEDENVQSCEYSSNNRTIYLSENAIRRTILSKTKRWPKDVIEKFIEIILSTVFDHELGHALKTQFGGGYKVKHDNAKAFFDKMYNILKDSLDEKQAERIFSTIYVGKNAKTADDLYKELIEKLSTINNGKYSSIIINPNELIRDYSFDMGTGVDKENESGEKDLLLLDELLQEAESMNTIQCYEIPQGKRIIGTSGNYINIYHLFSGYSSIIGYGKILIALLGMRGIFQATYLNPNSIFKEFNTLYRDISESVFQNDSSPITNISQSLAQIQSTKSETVYLKLDLFLAMCYERMINKQLSECTDLDIEVMLKEIDEIQIRLTNNDDITINSKLPHNYIFGNLKKNLHSFGSTEAKPKKVI